MDFFNHFVQKNIIRTSFLFVPFAMLGLSACDDNSTGADKIETGIPTSSSSSLSAISSSSSLLLPSNNFDVEFSNEFSIGGQGSTGKIRVVLRDFQANHPDFENFSGEAFKQVYMIIEPEDSLKINNDLIYNYVTPSGVAMKDHGYGDEWYSDAEYHKTCASVATLKLGTEGIQIGADGLPMQADPNLPKYLQQISAGPVLLYGRYFNEDTTDLENRHKHYLHGYENALGKLGAYSLQSAFYEWTSDVIYTPGMVKPHLSFAAEENGSIDMVNGVAIQKQNERCDNKYFDQWYADIPGVNKRTDKIIDVSKIEDLKNFAFDYNYNNGGFFPLDSLSPVNYRWIMSKSCDASIPPGGSCDQFGPQSYSIYCPPFDYLFANSQYDMFNKNTFELCDAWLSAGGPREPSAVENVSVPYISAEDYLRNYHFTMMGYASFRYNAANQDVEPEFFEFAADNDLWVFVDGVLVIDLGGTHMMTPGSVNLKTLAENNHGCHEGEPLATYSNCEGASGETGWADGSVHHLHVFYANRQTIGASFYFQPHLNN